LFSHPIYQPFANQTQNTFKQAYTNLLQKVTDEQDIYAKNPTAMPTKELEFLKFSKINKFASKIEGNADILGNTIIIN
jgi:hypothetical protein